MWPQGLPGRDPVDARSTLARRWLERFGPATLDDLEWWTGWNKTTVRDTIASLTIDEVDLHGRPGIALRTDDDLEAGDDREAGDDEPSAALLPSLDPTAMGWKHRGWFLAVDPPQLFDTSGNIGPTVWWNGEVIGSWAVTGHGEVRTVVVADRGRDAVEAIDAAAADLQRRLGDVTVTPAVRTPLERSLV